MKQIFASLLLLFALALTKPAYACPDIDGLVDLNCDGTILIVCFGDSITYGVADEARLGYPTRMRNTYFPNTTVVNLGRSGERTNEGRGRAAALFPVYGNADYFLILEGVNDYYQEGATASSTRNNLFTIVQTAQNTGAITLLANLTQVKRGFQQPWVNAVNAQINPFIQIDYFSLGQGIISYDLLHPNGAGYQNMAMRASGTLQAVAAANRPIDSDADGIYNFAESRFGTDVNNSDTDGDGLLDGAEVFIHGSSPLLLDTDGDSLTDPYEVNVLGSDPANPRPGAPDVTSIEIITP